MVAPESEAAQKRRRRTIWLLTGGAVSLLLPLAGLVYLRWNEVSTTRGPSGHGDVFERRGRDGSRVLPSQTLVPPVLASPPPLPPPGGAKAATAASASSLDFVKTNADMEARAPEASRAKAAAAPPPAPTAQRRPAPRAAAAPAKTTGKKKSFAAPKLHPSRGFTSLGGADKAPTGGTSGQDMQQLLKNLPPGAENSPEIQQYLKSQGP